MRISDWSSDVCSSDLVLGLLLLLELHRVLRRLAPTRAAVLARRVGPLVESLAALPVLEDVDAEAPRDLDLAAGVASHWFLTPHTRRRLGGRQPMWGPGVTSLIPLTSIQVTCNERIPRSRPAPGPIHRPTPLP